MARSPLGPHPRNSPSSLTLDPPTSGCHLPSVTAQTRPAVSAFFVAVLGKLVGMAQSVIAMYHDKCTMLTLIPYNGVYIYVATTAR